MLTVDEINKSFAEKGIFIELPLDPSFAVKGIRIMEKINLPAAVRMLLKIEYINQQGKSVSELIHCEGPVRKEKKEVTINIEPLKSSLLPTRSVPTFNDEPEALDYLSVAITHLLVDKGYTSAERDECDLYFERAAKNVVGFFINLAVRCDDKASERAKELIELRRQYGVYNDYALIVPAFQESLGLPLRLQERWIASLVFL